MSITKSSKDIKFSNNYNEIIKYLSLILDGTEADDTKKKSKKLETLLTETTKLTKDKEEKAKEIRKLETKKKSLKHVFAYHREAENQRTRLHDSIGQGDNLDTKWNNFLGTGGTKWKTHGWIKKSQDFYTDTNPIDNLYKINLGTEIETTEDQMIKTIARIVKALQKVDVADFTAKYNAKESDTTKQGQVATYLAEIKAWGAEVKGNNGHYDLPHQSIWQKYTPATNTFGTWTNSTLGAFNFQHFFAFVDLVADKPFLADLDADKQKDVVKTETWNIATKGEMWQLKSTDESMGLEDLGLNIKDYGTKVKLYKTGSDKRNFAVSNGIIGWLKLAQALHSDDNKNKLHKNFTADETNDPNKLLLADLQAIAPNADPNVNDHFIFDTNFALPESEEEMQLICDELEAAKLDSVMAGRLLQEKIDQIADEKQTIVADIKVKEGEIEGLIGEILTKKRERLTAYNISKGFAKTTEDNRRSLSDLYQIQQLLYEIRYLENDGDATANSSITEENTALTEIETILEEAGYYGGTTTYLVSYFQNLAFVAGDPEKFDIPQAISRIKAGKYKDSEGKEQDVRLFGDLTKFKTHFENKEKLVKLTEWELEAKQAIEKALNQDDNQQEKLSDWQSKLKTLDSTLDDTIITDAWKTKWGQVKKHGKIADVERLIKKVFADGKIKSEFLEEIKKSDATLVDLKSLLQKEPKDIITYIARFEYNQLPDTGDEKNKQKTQKKRRIAKKLSKTNESELKDEELNESLCKIEIGELTIDNTKYYKADLSEITTSEQEEQTFWTRFKTHMGNNWYWYLLGTVGGGTLLALIFWKRINSWWNGPAEEESTTDNTEEEQENDQE